ncbi:hypothetical protein QVD17_36990 [Tagetes erecta]|uniref:GATA-type domain-containing protein n=1 Tax=Tagetes erecta TaxID=13708 RepID=A0AAD8JV36_TARER|nr:hypothetical protein QVD17_36990 [Tagetes erecta]
MSCGVTTFLLILVSLISSITTQTQHLLTPLHYSSLCTFFFFPLSNIFLQFSIFNFQFSIFNFQFLMDDDCLQPPSSKPNFTPDHFFPVNELSADDFSIQHLLSSPTHAAFVEYDKPSPPKTELCFPVNDVDDLEWVSQFVEDSFSGDYSVTFPVKNIPETKTETETETETVTLVDVNPAFKNSVHKRARSKRRRTGGGVWSLRSSSPLTDCSSPSSSSTSSCTSKALLFTDDILFKPPVQMLKKKRPVQMGSGSGMGAGLGQMQARRCSHCGVQKTPQWRTGPLGAKTLCNACGVRFKSGRLLPEYRPACSPTFSSEVHSNNHRRVLEMRQKKAGATGGGGGGGLMLPVQGS